MKGMQALQKTADLTYSNEIPTSVYNPSGMYGQKAGPPGGEREEDGEAGPPQDGPHPHLRQVHGRALDSPGWPAVSWSQYCIPVPSKY